MGDLCRKLANSVVVLMQLFAHVANFLLHNVVAMFLILQHHFHQVKLALHETSSAQSRVNVIDVTGAPFIDCLEGCLQVQELSRQVFTVTCRCKGTNARIGSTSQSLRRFFERCSPSMSTLVELLVEDASLLVDLDNGSTVVIGDNSALLVSSHEVLLDEFDVARVFFGHGLLVANGHIRVNNGIGCRNMDQSVRVVSLGKFVQIEFASLSLRISIGYSI